ncbi:MAG: PAS domain S-box protein [Verrucomicrobiae bacterium]|nr:PAS domain S-box protein [Verrucomicrobiae bacterium]
MIFWENDAASGRCLAVNAHAEAVLGYPVNAWKESPTFWRDHLHPDDRETTVAFREAAIAEGKPFRQEYRMLTAQGRVVWLRDCAQIVEGARGRRLVVGVSFDVTEQHETEEALRESVRRYREMLENARLIAVSLDPQGTITFCNDFLLGLTGWERREVIGRDWFDLFAPTEGRESRRRRFLGWMRDGSLPLHVKTDLLTRSGRRRMIAWNHGILRDTRGGISGCTSIGEDVTERNELQLQVIHAQKMEALGRITGGVAHDFNNLLTAISGYSELLQMRLPEGDSQRKLAEEIEKVVDRASELTRRLLAFSRKQPGKPRRLNLNDIVANMDGMLRRVIGENIALRVVFDKDLHLVEADPGQLEMMVMNFAANARDAMPKGGTLTLETANLDRVQAGAVAALRSLSSGEWVALTVRDTGIGMDETMLSRMFEPFFTTKEMGKGTGLGLSTIYGIVRQSGGAIEVQSRVGEGTEFCVYLPQATGPQEPEKAEETPTRASRRGGETLLLAEDESSVRDLLTNVLTSEGYRVIHANDGNDALVKARNEKETIHLLLTDIVMPGLSGADLAKQLVAERPNLRVLFMSGHTGAIAIKPDLLPVPSAFLQKPFSMATLFQRVRDLLAEEAAPPARRS